MVSPEDQVMFDIYEFNDFLREVTACVPNRSEYFYIKLAEALATVKYMTQNKVINID